MPVAIGCDDLKYDPEYNKIEPVPNTLTGSLVLNENEMIGEPLYDNRRAQEQDRSY